MALTQHLRIGYQLPLPVWLQPITGFCEEYQSMSRCHGAITDIAYFLRDALGIASMSMSPPSTGIGWGQLYPNGTWDGVTGDMLKNLSDVTFASWHPKRCEVVDCVDLGFILKFLIAAPQPKIKSFFLALVQPFSVAVWWAIFASLILLLLAGKMMPMAYNGLANWATLLFNLLVCQDVPVLSKSPAAPGTWRNVRFTTIAGSWLIAAFFIGNLYCARLTDHLVNPFEKPLRTLDDVLKSGLPIEISPGEIALHDNLRNSKNPTLREVARVMKIVNLDTWWNYKYGEEKVFIDTWLTATSRMTFLKQGGEGDSWGKILVISDSELPSQRLVMYMRKSLPKNVKTALSQAASRIVETGLSKFWFQRGTKADEARLLSGRKDYGVDNELRSINIHNLRGVFILWGFALGLTCLVFITEIVRGTEHIPHC